MCHLKAVFFSISCISKLTRNYKQLIYNHGIHKVSFEDTHTRHIHNGVHTHSSEHAYTHPEQWAAIYSVAPGEQLGVWCLAQGSHLSRGIEGGESAGHSLPPPTIPARPETRTRNLWIT